MNYPNIDKVEATCRQRLKELNLDLNPAYDKQLIQELKDLKKWTIFLQKDKALELLSLQVRDIDSNKSGSLILFLLQISGIDPISNNLIQIKQKFGKADPPDIDVDLNPDCRNDIKEFLVSKFGQEHVCSVGTVGTYKTKNTILDVARALGYDIQEAMDVTKNLDSEIGEGDEETKLDKASFDEICQSQPALKAYFESHEDVRRHSEILRNQAKNYGTHAGGMIISNFDLFENIPVFKDKENRIVSAWAESGDFQELSSIGLVKFDLLSLTHLSIVRDCIEYIKENKGIIIERKNIPIDDKESIKLGTKGDLFGIFQFENPYTKKISDRVGVDCLGDIAAITSLIRPGPKDVGLDVEYAERKNGKPYDKNVIFEKVMGQDMGIMVYQEQLQKLAIEMAGFTPLEANALRKACAKKKADKMAELKPRFIQGSIEKSVKAGLMTEEEVHETWAMIESTASYSFNKSLEENTLVRLPDGGSRAIRDFKVGDSVLCFDGGKFVSTKVLALHNHGKLKLNHYIFENGTGVFCTPDHKFLTKKGMVKISLIHKNDLEVLFMNGDTTEAFKIDHCTENFVVSQTYDLEVESLYHNFVLSNSAITSNSHAIAYSALSTVELWLRHHYFCEYMTSLIQNADPAAKKFGDTIFDKYIKFAISGGLKIHKPDINISKERFNLKGSDVWFGFGHVKNVSGSSSAIEQYQPYTNMSDFYERCKVGVGDEKLKFRRPNSRVVESLIYAGAFDCFGTKEEMMKEYYLLSGKVEKTKLPKSKSEIKEYIIPSTDIHKDGLYELGEIPFKVSRSKLTVVRKYEDDEDCEFIPLINLEYDKSVRYLDLPDLRESALVEKETEILGVYFSENLAIKCREIANKFNVFTLRSAKHQEDKTKIRILGRIDKIAEFTSKAGNNYLRVTVSDGLWNYSFHVWQNSIYDFQFKYRVGDIAVIPLKNRGKADENPNDRFYDDNGEFKIVERNGEPYID